MARPLRLSLPLEYQQEIFSELRDEDELVVLARGLGLLRIVTNLLHSYDAAGNNLVVVVGAGERENGWIGEALAEHAAISMATKANGLTVVNTDLMGVGTREKLYSRGGILSITSRILVVDLLTNLLDPETITGVVVLHADRVVATSVEAFILRIYRQRNKVGFLKAFSDNPEPFARGISPLDTMMKNLFLRKVSIWPRFQLSVKKSLEGRKTAEVVELEIPMSDSMEEIHQAIMECVEVSISELKKSNPGVDMEEWNVDSALHMDFDVMVRHRLGPVWHRISWRSKQVVGDLTVLRSLLTSLLTYDAVSFHRLLDTVHAAHSPAPGSTRHNQSPWLFLDAAQTLFISSKRRLYTGKVDAKAPEDEMVLDALHPVLEEQPKWSELAKILREIDEDLYFSSALGDDSNGTILVMCPDTATCRQLREYLQNMYVHTCTGGDEGIARGASASFIMRRKLREYLEWKKDFAKIRASLFAENEKAAYPGGEARVGNNSGYRGIAPPSKRRRVRGGGDTGSATSRSANGGVQVAEEKPLQVVGLLSEIQPTSAESVQREEVVADPLENMEDFYQLYEMNDLVVLHAYDGDLDDHLLEEVKPRHVIMYEPDIAFIRRVEVYRSSHNDRNVKVYVMFYRGSIEEQRYFLSLRREKDVFERLIKEKAGMAVVMSTDAHGVEDPQEVFLRTINTRIAGGGRLAATAAPPRVVVDVREFRSSLPSLLHARSMVIVPCMLTVGDYILTPEICIERKSVRDLISSLRDGRLYNQVETMFQHYKSPMLLIEFDQDKSFTLEPFADFSGSLSSVSASKGASDLQSKIVLLTLAFPRLRIIWSSSPYQTTEIFESLKIQQEEPDPLAASRVGLDYGMKAEDQVFNREPQDMLRFVPGITAKNLKSLVLETGNIQDVANMTVGGLEPIVGREAGKQIWGFFNKSVLD